MSVQWHRFPDNIVRELRQLETDGKAFSVKSAKDRDHIYIGEVFCGYVSRSGKEQNSAGVRNLAANIRRIGRNTLPTVPRVSQSKPLPRENDRMTQNQEYAALAGRLGNIEQMLTSVMTTLNGGHQEQKIARALLEGVKAGVELLVDNVSQADGPPRPTLPRGWLRDGIKDLLKDGEPRHVFEIWKALKSKHEHLTENSVGQTCLALHEDGDIKRERTAVYYAEKEAEVAA